MPKHWTRLDRDLFIYRDSCNVYLLRYGERAIAIDFGTGRWLSHLDQIGVAQLEHVVLTHAQLGTLCEPGPTTPDAAAPQL